MSRNQTVLALPPFTGLTRRLILIVVSVYLGSLLLPLFSMQTAAWIYDHLMLHPDQALGKFPTQLVTYPFVELDLIGVLFSCLSLWFFASELEATRGSRWLSEYFFTTTICGALVACILGRTLLSGVLDIGLASRTSGLWGALVALTVAYGYLYPDRELTFNFLFRVKAKYLAVIYMLVYLALTLSNGHRFSPLVSLCAGLAGYVYLRFAPRQGLRFLASERWYGIRNAFYRRKRQQAAKKFVVHMRKEGREVNLDSSGKYISLDDERRDPNDKRWMN